MKVLIAALLFMSSMAFAEIDAFSSRYHSRTRAEFLEPERCGESYLSPGMDLGIIANDQVGSAFYAGGIVGGRDHCGLISGVFGDIISGSFGSGVAVGLIVDSVLVLKRTQFKSDYVAAPVQKVYNDSVSYTIGLHLFIIGFDVGTMVEDTPNGPRTKPLIGLNVGF